MLGNLQLGKSFLSIQQSSNFCCLQVYFLLLLDHSSPVFKLAGDLEKYDTKD